MLQQLSVYVNALRDREEGQTLVEYGLIIALVALVVATGLTALAGGLNTLFNDIVTTLNGL